jgi:mercuric ion binding protein
MKLRTLLAALLSGLPLLTSNTAEREPKTPPAPPAANATNWLAISGMHCEGCARGITSELKRTPGVLRAEVSFTNKLAVVAYDTNRVSLKTLQDVIAQAGYAAKPAKPPKPARR